MLLNIGEDWQKTLSDLMSTLTTTREEEKSSAVRFLLWCAIFAVRFAKMVVITGTNFVIGMNFRVIPNTITGFNEMLVHTSPNTLRCFNKTGLLIFFVDFYMMWFLLWKVRNVPTLSYVYAIIKTITIAVPLLYLSPLDRLPYWGLAAVVVLFEVVVVIIAILSWTYGIDWENAPNTIYRNWGKHYKYRRPTTNRKLLAELCCYLYPITKILILCGYFCYDPELAEARLKEPHLPTRGGVTSDFSYINALIEQDSVVNLRYGVLFLLALSSLSAYSIILAGWSSNSKYAFIGALRSAAQMISYEVAISLVILPIVILSGSLNLTMITHMQSVTTWFLLPLLPISILFLIAMLAETNRTPFDLPEAEAELVAGYNVDYSSLPFAMFFLAEYCNMILMATVFCKLFIGAVICQALEAFAAVDLALKAAVIWFFFVVVRAAFPRYRYDQLMDIGWKVFLPIAGGFLVFDFGVLLLFDALPVTGELPGSSTATCAVAGFPMPPI